MPYKEITAVFVGCMKHANSLCEKIQFLNVTEGDARNYHWDTNC